MSIFTNFPKSPAIREYAPVVVFTSGVFGWKSASLESNLEGVSVAGRVIGVRGQGKMIFIDVKDREGTIQVAAKSDLLLDKFELVKLIDIGDIVGFFGKI